jgi:mannosyl-oligosaccharide alpha-1,3-glucosidase
MKPISPLFALLALALALAAGCARAVDRGNFKTCDQSSFCKRHRAFSEATEKDWTPYVLHDDVATRANSRAAEPVEEKFAFGVHARADGIVELSLREAPGSVGESVRYAGPLEILTDVADAAGEGVKRTAFGGFSSVTDSGASVRAVVAPGDSSSGLRVSVEVNGKLAVVANERDFLMFEPAQKSKDEDQGCQPKQIRKADAVKPDTWNEETEGAWEAPLEENPACANRWDEDFKSHQDTKPHGPMSVGLDFSFPDASSVYGIPEHAAPLNLPNTRPDKEPFRMYNLDVFEYELDNEMALYGHVPIMLAHSVADDGTPLTVGVFWFNSAEMWIDIADRVSGPGRSTHWFSESGDVRAFILPGPTAKDVLRQYAKLTGPTALPPMFALGYQQCKWNYKDEKEVAEVDAGFDAPEADMPYDVIWLDIEHTDGKRYFTWDSTHFPTPQRMIDQISAKGRRMVTIVDPHIKRDSGYSVHNEATDRGLYIKNKDGADYDGSCWPGSSSWVDFTNPEARSWWAGRFALDSYQGSTPALFTWNDMNEPSVFSGPEVSMHKDAKHWNNAEHRDVHNVYGLYQQMATAQGQIERSGGVARPFVLSRAFFPGTQRWGPIWTGDNAAKWDHLEASTPMLLACGLGGIAFAGADVGGFFGNPEPELQTRWYQAGAFQPFFRGHGHIETKRREPFLAEEPHRNAQRNALKQRYAMLPFWYTLFFENQREGSETYGVPPMRPLWLEFPNQADLLSEQDTFMIGDALLVAPVVKEGASSVDVKFPAGARWFRVFDDGAVLTSRVTTYASGQSSVEAPLERGTPVFQRGGSIVPLKLRPRRSSSQMLHDPFTLQIAVDESGAASGTVFVDDEVNIGSASAYRKLSFSNGVLSNKCASSCEYDGVNEVERILVMGLAAAPSRVSIVQPGSEERDVQHSFSSVFNVLTIRQPRVGINADWEIRVH